MNIKFRNILFISLIISISSLFTSCDEIEDALNNPVLEWPTEYIVPQSYWSNDDGAVAIYFDSKKDVIIYSAGKDVSSEDYPGVIIILDGVRHYYNGLYTSMVNSLYEPMELFHKAAGEGITSEVKLSLLKLNGPKEMTVEISGAININPVKLKRIGDTLPEK